MRDKPYWEITVSLRFKKSAEELRSETWTPGEEEWIADQILDRMADLITERLSPDLWSWDWILRKDHIWCSKYLAEVKG